MGFYRHDQWGFACLADEVQVQGLQRRGQPPVPFHFYRQTTIKGGNISTMHKHMVEGWNLMYMLLMCETIPFKWSVLQMICKYKLQFEFNLAKLQMLLWDQCNSFWNVYDMPLRFKYNVICWYGSKCKSIWKEFELIPFKSNSKCYWSHFKLNSNMVENWKFG